MSLEQAKKWVSEQLRQHTCEGADAEREARELVDFFATNEEGLRDAVQRRLQHEPLGYILGWTPFLGRRFTVTPDVLIPRPATEIIVTRLIEDWRDQNVTVIDVGTGSGVAAISFALELPRATIIAIDISESALHIAKQNAEILHVADGIQFVKNDLLNGFPASRLPDFPTIVFANLPYIPTADIDQLIPDVRDYEPRTALDGGPDGFDLYRQLFKNLPHFRPATFLSSKRTGSRLDRRETSAPPPFFHQRGRGPASTGGRLLHLYLEALPHQLDELAQIATQHFPNSDSEKITADSAGQYPIGLVIKNT